MSNLILIPRRMAKPTSSFLLLISALVLCLDSSASFQTTARAIARSSTLQNRNSQMICNERLSSSLQAINGERKNGDSKQFPADLPQASYNFIGLTTNGGKYVPGGLTEEEYENIKTQEAEKLSKMNFAAWGPRFKRTEVPDGDWMVQPALWVQGFQSTRAATATPLTKEEWELRKTRRRQLKSIRSVATSFLFAYMLMDILLLSSASIRSASTSKRILTSMIARKGVLLALKQHLLASLAFSKIQCLKLSLAAVATPLLQRYREIAQRRWLWSKRRQFGTPLLASVAFVSTWVTVAFRVAALR